MENPFSKNYRTLRRWQVRCQENYVDCLRQLAPNDHRALAHAEETLAQMQAALFDQPAGQVPAKT